MKTSVFLLHLLAAAYSIAFDNSAARHLCFSDVFCYGPLLETVQMSRIFNDSKTFVDMKMNSPPKKTLTKFSLFMATYKNDPNQAQVRRFVAKNFKPGEQEFLEWEPNDWKGNPKFLERTGHVSLKEWGYSVNRMWKSLGRKTNIDVLIHQDWYSMIWVPKPVVVPNGSFREFYYWDSYFIIKGLLLSEMFTTAKGMLENFLYLVKKHGHIPQGNRIYYLERSPPPLLTPMVKLYLNATDDLAFLKLHVDILESEFDYWIQHRTRNISIHGKTYTLAAYGENSKGPRPEFCHTDVRNAEFFGGQKEKDAFYSEIKASAEAGWDSSRRWFISNKTNQGNVTNIKTRSIIPVDLNAIMFWNAKLLWEFNEILGHKDKAAHFQRKAEDWLEAVTKVLWHEDLGTWLDYDLQNSVRREQFYLSNVAPLWTGCYLEIDKKRMVRGVLQYLNKQDVYNDGTPISTNSGERWDYPNIEPTLQYMLVVGLSNTELEEAEELALKFAASWIKKYFMDFDKSRAVIKKYNEIDLLDNELSIERKIQLGSGWNIGIVLALLDQYGSEIAMFDTDSNNFRLNGNLLFNTFLLCVILIIVLSILICVCCFKKRRNYQNVQISDDTGSKLAEQETNLL